jgi:excisionase family DNA binding protein
VTIATDPPGEGFALDARFRMFGPDRTPDSGHDARDGTGGMTAREAAERVGVNERTIRRAIARDDLPAVKRRGIFVIDVASLDAWHASRDGGTPSTEPDGHAVQWSAPWPEPVTPLIGRERELAMAVSMLRRDDVRLLTLTGAGGIGKTRLSIAVASQLRADFAEGVHIVPLAEVPDAGVVATAIAERLGLPDADGVDGQRALVTALREAHALLVLDNFEHVMAAALVADLLRSCPRIKLLVTSRSLLRIGGEHALPVPPLELPDAEIDPSIEQVVASPALRLFADRARAIAPSFAITPANASAVAAICHRLGGLPLAIELAASQITVLPPDALLARVEAHLPLPLGGPRDAPDRQRTMADAIAWSHALLSPPEQRLFRRIGVFVGGFALDAAEAVNSSAGDASPADTLTGLAALVDASLVQRARDDTGRFTMLEPIRAFALERLAAEGELDSACDILADWCLALAERSPMAVVVPGGERHLLRLDADHANIRRVLEWLCQRRDEDRLLRLTVALGGYWYERNHYREGRMWTERALAASERAESSLRARAMVQLGLFLGILGDPARARELAADGVALLRAGGDPEALSPALIWQGGIAIQNGAYDEAVRAFGDAIDLAETVPDASLAGAISARATSNLGIVAHLRGDLDAAVRWHGLALAACREHGYLLGTSRSLCDLGDIARDRGDYAASVAHYRESLSVLGERSDLRTLIAALEGAALASVSWKQYERAARLLGAAAGLSEAFNVPIFLPTDQTAHERAMRGARPAMDERRFDELFAAGHRLTPAEAIAEVLAVTPPGGDEHALPAPRGRLSPREREVLRLLAAGLRDREIAERLFISVRTVEGHVRRIIAKLNAPTRVAAARAAIDLGLAGPDR